MSDDFAGTPAQPQSQPGPQPESQPQLQPESQPQPHSPTAPALGADDEMRPVPLQFPLSDEVPTDAPAAANAPALAAAPTPTRRRLRWLWWTAGSIAVTALVGLCAYLVVVANQWSDRVDDLTVVSEDLGTQVADQTAARLAAEEHATSLQSQLDTATARISDLAHEEATATDHEAVWINMVDSVFSCADNRQKLIDALKDSRLYFPGQSKAQVEAEITTYCDGLKTEYTDFKAEIGK